MARTLSLLAGLPLRMLIAAYRYGLSPVLPGSCRFHPSCSAYAEQAIRIHGPLRGGWLALRRIARCRPFGGWGYDPAPPAPSHQANPAAAPDGADGASG